MRILCIFSFLYILDTLFIYFRSYDHIVIANLVDIYIYIYTHLRLLLQFFHLSLHVLPVSLYAHATYILYAILYFCFTLRCLDEFFFKCFRKYRLSKSTCHKLSSCKVFQEFVIG